MKEQTVEDRLGELECDLAIAKEDRERHLDEAFSAKRRAERIERQIAELKAKGGVA